MAKLAQLLALSDALVEWYLCGYGYTYYRIWLSAYESNSQTDRQRTHDVHM